MKKLKSDIENGAFEPVYLITGPEAYLRQQAKAAFVRALAGGDGMNYCYREGREAEISEIIGLAETLPFFAEKRLILLENTGLVKKGGEELAEYLPDMPDFTVLVLVEEEADKRSKLYKTIDKCGYIAECDRKTEDELKRFALAGFTKAGRRITPGAMDLFLDRCGDDLGHLVTEQEKLIAYTLGRDIREEDVQAITSVTAQNRVFDMIDAIALGKPREAFLLYEDLVALREPPMRLMYLITQSVNRLLQVKELDRRGLRAEEIARETGLRPFAVKKTLRQAAAFSEERLRLRLEKMAEYDSAVKSGALSDTLAVELILAELGGKYD